VSPRPPLRARHFVLLLRSFRLTTRPACDSLEYEGPGTARGGGRCRKTTGDDSGEGGGKETINNIFYDERSQYIIENTASVCETNSKRTQNEPKNEAYFERKMCSARQKPALNGQG
jgi:hypothetical protein